MNFVRILLLLQVAGILLLSSCRKSSNANWDVDAVLPVVNSKMNIKNFISDTLFQADASGLLHLKINRELIALKLDSFVTIPSTTIPVPLKNPIFDQVLQPGSTFDFQLNPFKFDPGNGVSLSTIEIRRGEISVQMSNDLSQPLDIYYALPNVRKDGKPFVINETLPPKPGILKKVYHIDGYTFDLTVGGSTYNTLTQVCSASLAPGATSVSLPYNQGADVALTFGKVEAQFIEGFFGRQEVDINKDTADISFLDNFKASNFLLSDAKMDFTLINEFGVDFRGGISSVKAINSRQNTAVVLSSSQLESINIDRATRVGYEVTGKSKLFSFNTSNSNITSFISVLPDMIEYKGNVTMNPLPENNGNVSGSHDFAVYDKGIRLLANIDIPMKFRADYFELESWSDIEFSKNKALDGVNSGRFVVYASNGFPFSANVQAYMYDEKMNMIDSVFVPGQNTIEHGLLNNQNEVTAATKSTVSIPVTKSKIDNLVRCRKLRIVSKMLMPPNPPDIGIYEKYGIDINITAEVNYNVDLSR